MAKIKAKLTRALRKSIQQGHPWVYREAMAPLENLSTALPTAALARVSDSKGELGWAIYDPHSPLALRILSTDAAPPSFANGFYARRFAKALKARDGVRSDMTTAFRLFNGEGDLLPGLVCDVYGDVAVLQFDGQGPSEFWDRKEIATWLLENASVRTVIEKTRRSSDRTILNLAGEDIKSVEANEPATVIVKENGAHYKVNLEKGQKTGFFLDQRDNRFYVRQSSKNKSVLNLFSYTGGFSISAGLGGASRVASVDISAGAIAGANDNWALNGLAPANHQGLAVDVFDYLSKEGGDWDHVIVDPPSMSHSEDRKEIAIQKYTDLFATAAKRVRSGAELSLSSCSSHVSFEDFFKIISESLSLARRRGQILRVSGQGADHPFPHAAPELRYLKFVHLALD